MRTNNEKGTSAHPLFIGEAFFPPATSYIYIYVHRCHFFAWSGLETSYTSQLSQGPLPSGWEERTASTGRPYFVCHHTRVSQVNRFDLGRCGVGSQLVVAPTSS